MILSKLPILLAGTASALLLTTAGMAQTANEDLQALDARVANFAASMGATAVPIDRRIRLMKCPQPAAIEPDTSGSLAVRCPDLGWRMRVSLNRPAGARLSQANAPILVKRGDNVHVTISSNAFAIDYTATATENGREGDMIGLRFGDKNTVIEGKVSGPGQAVVSE